MKRWPSIAPCAALLTACAGAAWGADAPPKLLDPAASLCQWADDDSIQRLEQRLDYVDHMLPNIPPEEDRYLTAESERGMKVYQEEQDKHLSTDPSDQILSTLAARKLYYPWKIRKELAKLKHDVAKILSHKPSPEELYMPTYRGNDEAEKLKLAAQALDSAHSYSLQVQEYMTRGQLGKAPPVLASEQFLNVYGGLISLTPDLANYIQCKLAKIMGPQPLPWDPLPK
jgi:hypothetical protein